MKSLGFFTVAMGEEFEQFVAPYITSTQLSYPGSVVEVLVEDRGRFLKNHAEQVAGLNQHFEGRFWINSKFYDELSHIPEASFRWAMRPLDMPLPEVLYIGDVDIIVLPYSPKIDEHLVYMDELGLPYSNILREGRKRLSGLHVVRAADYFEKLTPDLVLSTAKRLHSKSRFLHNEEFLYRLMDENFGLPEKRVPRPTHGIHVSLARPMLPGENSRGDFTHWQVYDESDCYAEKLDTYKKLTEEAAWKHMSSLFSESYRRRIKEIDLFIELGYAEYTKSRLPLWSYEEPPIWES